MGSLIDRFVKVSTEENSIGNRFRQKRMLHFKEAIQRLNKPLRILDVGGNQDFWVNAGFHQEEAVEITILNLKKTETTYPHFHGVAGDATNLSQYEDNRFDIAFSNSVIEHLYTRENQQKMAREMQRVGHYFYVQTPNKYFFLEPHYLLPYFQFIPKKLGYFILTKTRLSRNRRWEAKAAQQYLDEIRLLGKSEFQGMFHDGYIWKEKFMGMSKSFVAHNFE